MGSDPMLGDVAWSWFTDALASADLDPLAAGGTVTRVLSQSFGSLDVRAEQTELEIRASWTAADEDLAPHLRAWAHCCARRPACRRSRTASSRSPLATDPSRGPPGAGAVPGP